MLMSFFLSENKTWSRKNAGHMLGNIFLKEVCLWIRAWIMKAIIFLSVNVQY